MFTNSVLFRWK